MTANAVPPRYGLPIMRAVYKSITRIPGGRRVLLSPRVDRLRRAVRQAMLVRGSGRYALAGVLEPRGIHRHELRGDGTTVWLRHPADTWAFEEIFRAGVYELPDEVAAVMPAAPQVLDLGANVGLFGAFALRALPEARIVGYEPDPGNAKILELTLADPLREGRYTLRCAAAGAHAKIAKFAVELGGRSHLGSGERTISVEVRDVMAELASSDLAKVDIEGGEWPILADPRLARAGPRALVLEYHAWGCPGTDPGVEAETLLVQAGYKIVPGPRPYEQDEFPEGQGVLWAVRHHPERQ